MKTIMVVDDQEIIIDLYKSVLSRTYEVLVAPIDSLEKFKEFFRANELRIACVICDAMIGVFDGDDVVKIIRQEFQSQVPVLVACSPSEIAEKMMNLGANRFLSKPFDLNHLVQTVNDLTAGQ